MQNMKTDICNGYVAESIILVSIITVYFHRKLNVYFISVVSPVPLGRRIREVDYAIGGNIETI